MTAHLCPSCGSPLSEIPGFTVNEHTREVSYRGATVELGRTRFALFTFLLKRGARLTSTGSIYDHLYSLRPDCDKPETSKIVDVHICHLRREVAPLGVKIRNTWGAGYTLEIEDVVTKAAAE